MCLKTKKKADDRATNTRENVVGFRHSALNPLEVALLTIILFSPDKTSLQGRKVGA